MKFTAVLATAAAARRLHIGHHLQSTATYVTLVTLLSQSYFTQCSNASPLRPSTMSSRSNLLPDEAHGDWRLLYTYANSFESTCASLSSSSST
ncbi:hypothetical protein DVH05_021109 [Phytophthora capsici]|nr:hypothetical protein DVH05_021109 [Phytophthora capsici]